MRRSRKARGAWTPPPRKLAIVVSSRVDAVTVRFSVGLSARDAYRYRLLSSRIDALTMAFRVRLAPSFVETLKKRAEIASEHGRAGIEYENERGAICGELRWSRTQKVWNVTREPSEPEWYGYRLHVDMAAPGGGNPRECEACGGTCFRSMSLPCARCRGGGCALCEGVGSITKIDECRECKGSGFYEEPGFTLEIVWYAQSLAMHGLQRLVDDSARIARTCGEVYEARVRRIDLCADVEGWDIRADDVRRLAKRPRAKWAVDDAGLEREEGADRKESRGCHGTGALERRRITGISVGRGGALMCRVYDKRAEVERDERRRELEEARWRDAGWKGVSPVARVEFQIRGVVLHEFGLRDPDAVVDPETRAPLAVCGECGSCRSASRLLPCDRCGSREIREQATIVHRIPDVWRTCLAWVRLVVPSVTRNGRPIPVSRLPLDERWELLHRVRWDRRPASLIHRVRIRGAASAAQALGVALSSAARDGRITRRLSEAREAYADDADTLARLRRRVRGMMLLEADRIVDWLDERYEGPAGAAVHFAVRSNAARLRFKRGVVDADLSTGPPDGDGPLSEVRARGGAPESVQTFDARGAVA
jgi:hypothetical protein